MNRSQMLARLAKVVRDRPSRKYLAVIRSQAWRDLRVRKFRTNPNCEVCHIRPAIQLHHWTYIRLGKELLDDVCSICLHCHHEIHCMTIPTPANDNQLPLPLPEVRSG